MGMPEEFGPGTVLFSFGPENTVEEVDRFLGVFGKTVEQLRAVE
jgi:cysteine sulfinate desulfinase/cysteine desulfurase-like protein